MLNAECKSWSQKSGKVVTVVLFAMDVDLLESSSQQSLFRHGFATCVCSVRDVARLGILSRKHQLEQKV